MRAYFKKVTGDFVELLQMPKGWEFDQRGVNTFGRGDSCWRLGLFLIAIWNSDAYTMEFKLQVKDTLVYLLTNRIRYVGDRPKFHPDKNWQTRIKYRFTLKKSTSFPFVRFKYKRYGSPKWFTKDQMIMGMVALYLTGHYTELRNIKTPLFLSSRAMLRPNTYYFFKALKAASFVVPIRKKDKYIKKFHFWSAFDSKLPSASYALHLSAWMLFVFPHDDVSFSLFKKVGYWNILIQLLIGTSEPIGGWKEKIDAHESISGFCWQGSEIWDGKVPTQDNFYITEGVKLDKIVLESVYEMISNQ